jgi:hypothetical protein
MKTNRKILYRVFGLGAIAAVLVGIWLARSSADGSGHAGVMVNGVVTGNTIQTPPAKPAAIASTPRSDDVRAGLQAIFSGMEKAGARRLSSAHQSIDEALKTKDIRAIAQAAHALVYDSPWPRAEVIEALRMLLVNDQPEIRLVGARFLYLIGDISGRKAIMDIMSSKSPIEISSLAYTGGRYDLRFKAAELASKYRDRESKDAVLALYQSTRSRGLLHCLVNLEVDNVGQMIKDDIGNQPSYRLMELYGLAKFNAEASYMEKLRRDESLDMRTRLAAAWARTQVVNDYESAKFIRDFVDSQVPKFSADLAAVRGAVQYLGTQKDAESIALLERVAKQSNNVDLVRTAAANLVLNHSGQSTVGSDLVIEELTHKPAKLGIELAVKLAVASTDPRLKQAGRSFDARREGERIWKREGVNREQWSLWGWADEYVLVLGSR